MIAIASPTPGNVRTTYASDLIRLIQYDSNKIKYLPAIGSYIGQSRASLIQAAIKEGCSHILFIDSDMRFPPNTLEWLLARKKEIVGANCKTKKDVSWTARKNKLSISSKDKTGFEEVNILGFGVILIDLNIYTRKDNPMPKNSFMMPWDSKYERYIGEDVYFCTIAKELGIKIYVDHDISQQVRHTSTVEL